MVLLGGWIARPDGFWSIEHDRSMVFATDVLHLESAARPVPMKIWSPNGHWSFWRTTCCALSHASALPRFPSMVCALLWCVWELFTLMAFTYVLPRWFPNMACDQPPQFDSPQRHGARPTCVRKKNLIMVHLGVVHIDGFSEQSWMSVSWHIG